MKRLLSWLVFIIAVLALLLPITAVTAAPRAYREGVEVHLQRDWGTGYTNLDLRATKLVDGRYRQTLIEIEMDTARWYIERQTVVLLGDPDQLEVSRDLGWGGLEARDAEENQLWVWLTFKDTGIRQLHPLWLTFTLRADESNSYQDSDGYFYRSASIVGAVNVNYYVVWFDWWVYPTTEVARTFSDQWPGR